MKREWIFGYGSLANHEGGLPAEYRKARLRGYRRTWNVAMDNRDVIPGYKLYLDRETGERPSVYVTFLNIAPDPDGWVNGLVFPVPVSELPAFDGRERNYVRRDVSELVDVDVAGRVWAYVGRSEAEARFERGREQDSAVVSRQYVQRVRKGFAELGAEMLDAFDATTDSPDIPERDLERRDVPVRPVAEPG
jgi:cation transport regulator ChaC